MGKDMPRGSGESRCHFPGFLAAVHRGSRPWGLVSRSGGAGRHGASCPRYTCCRHFAPGSCPAAPSQGSEHRATLLLSSFPGDERWACPLKVVELCNTCIHRLVCEVNHPFVFLSGLFNGLLPHQVEILYFIFFWLSIYIYFYSVKKIQLIWNVQSRKWNMPILATATSLPRLPSVNNSELESDFIKVSHLLILFTLEWVFTLWDLSHFIGSFS